MKIIYFTGSIGGDLTAEWFRNELKKAAGKPVEIHIASGGGNVFVGQTMIDEVRRYPGQVTARLVSVAASMASALAVACDHVVATDQASFMIHKAAGYVHGNSDDMAKEQTILNGIDLMLAKLYSNKSGRSVSEIQELMTAESWYFANEILEAGFCDEYETEGEKQDRASALYDAKERFAAAYHKPTMAEVAAYAGTTSQRVKSFDQWRTEYPNNRKVQEICSRSEAAGRSPESCVIALTLAANPRALTKDEREMCRQMNLSESEFLRYSEGV